MSGIAAIYDTTGRPVAGQIIRQMIDSIPHRGPDGSSVWFDGPVALGHALLRTTPESQNERQPLIQPERGLVITAHARVDNRAELRTVLTSEGLGPLGETDADLLLGAYALWGEECADHIIGDFAFAIWDMPRQRLFLARDPIGVKPLLYWFEGRLVVVASEPVQFFQHPAPSREVNWALVGDYLCGNRLEPEETLYAGVRWLRGGDIAVADRNGFRVRRYWRPNLRREIRYRRPAQYAEHFRDLLEQSVQCRLRASGPIGILLSGGLDSSSIVCLAQKLRREHPARSHPFETISCVFPGLECDESEFIDAVTRELDVHSNRVLYDEKFHAAARLANAQSFPDVGFGFWRFGYMLTIADCARRRGIRVLLDGIGGDELFLRSPDRMADSLLAGRLRLLTRQLRSFSKSYRVPLWRVLIDHAVVPLLPKAAEDALRWSWRRVRPAGNGIVRSWLDPDFGAQYGLQKRWDRCMQAGRVRAPSFAQRLLYNSLTRSYNVLSALPSVERFSMAFSLERCHPFLDRRLIEYCLAISGEERVPEGGSKVFLRQAMGDLLPEAIRRRESKPWFDSLIEEQVNRRQAEAVSEIFSDSRLETAGVIRKGESKRLLAAYRRGEDVHHAIDEILELELWYRAFLAVAHSPELETQRC